MKRIGTIMNKPVAGKSKTKPKTKTTDEKATKSVANIKKVKKSDLKKLVGGHWYPVGPS